MGRESSCDSQGVSCKEKLEVSKKLKVSLNAVVLFAPSIMEVRLGICVLSVPRLPSCDKP